MVRHVPHILFGGTMQGVALQSAEFEEPARRGAAAAERRPLAAMCQRMGSGSTRSDGVWSRCFSEEGVLSGALEMKAIAAEGRWGLGQHGGNRKGDADAKPAVGGGDSAYGVWKMQPDGKRKGDA